MSEYGLKQSVPENSPQGAFSARRPASPGSGLRVDLLLLSVILIWGMNFPIMKSMYAYFEPFAFTLLRFSIAASILVFILKLRGLPLRVDMADLPALTGLAVLSNTLYQVLFNTGLVHTKAGNAALLGAAAPIFAYLTGILMKREWYRHRVLVGILLSFAGASVIVLFGAQEIALGANWRGDVMILASALCWGGYTGAAARMVIKYGALRLTVWIMVIGAALMIPPFLPAMLHQNWLAVPLVGWLGLSYSTFLSIVYCYLIWSFALQHIGVSRTAVYSNLTPLVAMLGGWLILGERPALAQFAGVVLILGGVYIVRSKKSAYSPMDARLQVVEAFRQKAK